MKWRLYIGITIFLLIIAGALAIENAQTPLVGESILALSPESGDLKPGEEFTITLKTDVGSESPERMGFNILFPKDKVTYVKSASLLKDWDVKFVPQADSVFASGVKTAAGEVFSDAKDLATITFKVNDDATGQVALDIEEAGDPNNYVSPYIKKNVEDQNLILQVQGSVLDVKGSSLCKEDADCGTLSCVNGRCVDANDPGVSDVHTLKLMLSIQAILTDDCNPLIKDQALGKKYCDVEFKTKIEKISAIAEVLRDYFDATENLPSN